MNPQRRLSKESIEELKQIGNNTIPSFEEAKKGYDRVNKPGIHHNGFTFIPHLNKAFSAPEGKELQALFGDGKNPLHFIAITDEPGKDLNVRHRVAYNKLIVEGKIPSIGGYHEDLDNKDYTDVAFFSPMTDEEAREQIKKYKQRSSGRYDLDGSFKIFS